MEPKIHKAGENKKLKMLVHGPAGHGKTRLLGTANLDPRMFPILVLDFEGGESTLAGSDVDIWTIRSWEDYNEAYNYIASGRHPYQSIGIDSLSETHTSALLQILEAQASKREDPDMLQIQDYGKAGIQLKRLIREFRDLPYHVIFIAGSKDEKDPREGMIKVPNMSGQIGSDATHMMDVVTYLALATNKDGTADRALLLHGHPKFRTKARASWGREVPTELENPSLSDVLDALGYPMPKEAAKAEPEPAYADLPEEIPEEEYAAEEAEEEEAAPVVAVKKVQTKPLNKGKRS